MGKFANMTAVPKQQKDINKDNPQISDITISTYHDITSEGSHEAIRKAVKQLGKETTNYRFTRDEKETIEDLVYSYKKRGIRTNENEIMRIALNLLLADYTENGDVSVLSQVLALLNS